MNSIDRIGYTNSKNLFIYFILFFFFKSLDIRHQTIHSGLHGGVVVSTVAW